MAKKEREAYFWTSYSDLMTSLFFVMLVLFVLTITLLHTRIVASEKERAATQSQLDKISEIEESVNRIDSNYFDYNDIYKKHILKIRVNFPVGVSEMKSIGSDTRNELLKAGKAIQNSLKKLKVDFPEIKYLLIIEGQSSKDYFQGNYELSYERALALNRFWLFSNIDFGDNCEVIISGSGTGGTMRDTSHESNNQRFLIHIVPKPGIIEASK
ncbi:MAG: hypothetical protein PHI32_05355 [Dysgonamonadaceae bacterium]|nr:hypothetical protein [Dysgonamonadaceae bacterium]MDD4729430.1 hypothetical protein [Dysgonamonadaceae bacterium]